MKRPFGKRPFSALVEHFVRRLTSSEQEQGSASLGFGVGAVLAIIASPGAFASLFLIDKYSTLLQWLRGHFIDPIPSSPTDEHFFIVLSMTITGLVLVARWNRLFPDRRDFANLAVLPLPVRHIFLANLLTLQGLAVLVAVVANAVSAFVFPLFVTISIGTFAALIKVAFAHAVSVFASSLFSFFVVFALVGLLTLLVPRAIFRPVSVLARVLLLVGLLSEFLANASTPFVSAHVPASVTSWLPSFWFLGNYEVMVGIAKPEIAVLAQRAWAALGVLIVFSLATYALCYQRIFLRLPESFDMFASRRGFFRIRLPEAILQPLFHSPFERACMAFTCKALLRSETHMMFFGAWLGIGLVIVGQTVLSSPSSSIPLAVPLLIAFFLVSGLRFVFEIPAALDANWIFRVTADPANSRPADVARRVILFTALPWQVLVFLPLAIHLQGPLSALLQTAFNLLFTVLFTELLLVRFPKIPFTCFTQFDIRQLLNRMLLSVFGLLILVPMLAAIESWTLPRPLASTVLLVALVGTCYFLAKRRREAEPELMFEDTPVHFQQLKIV